MKKLLLLTCVLFSSTLFSQVGIGTTTPNSNALLDIDASSNAGGLLLPRISLSGTLTAAPLTNHVAGMTIYNTATTADVTPGFYFNNGSTWVRLDPIPTPSLDWTANGNTGTNPATQFIGTTDNQPLRIRTFNNNAFEVTSGNAANRGRLRAYSGGSSALPVFSWQTDTDTGMYRIGGNTIGFATNALERVRINNNGDMGVGSINPLARFHTEINVATKPAVLAEITVNNSTYAAGEFYNPNITNGAGIWATGYDGIYTETTDYVNGWAGYFLGDIGVDNNVFANAYVTWSDRRIKKNIETIDNALQLITLLKPAKYEKKFEIEKSTQATQPDKEYKKEYTTEYGLIAQEVEQILPELVSEKALTTKELGAIDLKAVNYTGLIPILIKATQEQQILIEEQNNKIEEQNEKIALLQKAVDSLLEEQN